MSKTLWVAIREFNSTVLTKGFLIGILLTPVFLLIVVGAIAVMKNLQGPRIVGTVAVIDQTGVVMPFVEKKFNAEAVKAEVERDSKAAQKMVEEKAGAVLKASGQSSEAVSAAVKQVIESGPKLSLQPLPNDANVDQEKEPVARAVLKTRSDQQGEAQRLGLVVIPPEVLKPDAEGKYGSFTAYFAPKLDFEVQQRVERRVGDAVVDARLSTHPKLLAGGITPEEIRPLLGRPAVVAKTATDKGDKKSLGELRMLIPMFFLMLLFISVMTSGQSLLTTTVEEKSSRVMEVLLSAVSPMQLMVGKILGQMGVGLLVLVLYSGVGIAGMAWFALQEMIEPSTLVYLVIFFLIAYFLVASLFAAIGSAVNEMREAQTLMTPVMMVLMIPWLIWFLIQRAPNSTLATVLSFVPGMNPFVMVIRLSGSEPVPAWQIPVAIGVGVLSVIAAAWAAAKVFRIGVLMYGKPPDFKTLIKWVRMA